ncbi:efflux RND transporter periplasmic adaptor subunit [Azospira inquinata]|uniref:Efflux RND transporter periplasmic adaptor subunit n=1 Tax=Azospira inquinata TaxID=2785627 RepID=A0A975XVU1_9RHOO|nr:efflux RND transporter periplasmic adaptor subunit [Azospira inquinata]QWT47163.1 efflux RND transporter periplasmic adaptor subunit [Azospira inquinata]QWT50207.1 efflux RND transporter periplasmic adaptor subunit [Azospira inquinata]
MSFPHAPTPSACTPCSRHPFRLRLALSLAGLALLAACHKEAPPPAAAPTDPNLVTIGPDLANQIKVATVGSAPISETLRVAGRLDFDEQHLARIGATVTGRITQVSAILGQNVKAGQPLAQLNSTELSDAQLAFLKANAQAQLERRNVDRAQQLYSADVIGKAELQRRENEAAIAQAERQAAADQLRVLGMSLGDVAQLGRRGTINSVTPVLSSIAGTVVERKVTQGQVVAPADALFTVADLGQLWAVADVPEQEAALVQPGQDVELEIPALGGERLHSKLIYVGDTVDPETRTVMVRTVLQNPERRLKPAMLATMLIAGKARPRLVIPAAAVVRQDNGDYVFQQLKPGQFRLIPVTLGPETAGHRVVLSGLKEGTPIVVDGAFHLNNQRQAKELEGGA